MKLMMRYNDDDDDDDDYETMKCLWIDDID